MTQQILTKCLNCQADIVQGAHFCRNCGTGQGPTNPSPVTTLTLPQNRYQSQFVEITWGSAFKIAVAVGAVGFALGLVGVLMMSA